MRVTGSFAVASIWLQARPHSPFKGLSYHFVREIISSYQLASDNQKHFNFNFASATTAASVNALRGNCPMTGTDVAELGFRSSVDILFEQS
mgnify:CR=1